MNCGTIEGGGVKSIGEQIDQNATSSAQSGNEAATYGWSLAGVTWEYFGAEGVSQIASKGQGANGGSFALAAMEVVTLGKGKVVGRAGVEVAAHSKEFSGALTKAVSWLETKGFAAEKATIAKFGENAGKPIGMQTLDGKIGFRVEYDARNGAHINVWAGKEKGPHFTFEASSATVDRIVKLFQ